MFRLRFRSIVPVPAADLFAWHASEGAFERLAPPWQNVVVLHRDGSIMDGDVLVMEVRAGPLGRRWIARHSEYIEGQQFRDTQIDGPFSAWSHLHRIHAQGQSSSVLDDDVTFALPLSPVSHRFAGSLAKREIRRMFRFRHLRTRLDVWRHHAYRDVPRKRVTVIGSHALARQVEAFLTGGGHSLTTEQEADVVIDLREMLEATGAIRASRQRVVVHSPSVSGQAHPGAGSARQVTLTLPDAVVGQSFQWLPPVPLPSGRSGMSDLSPDAWIAEEDLIGLIYHAALGMEIASDVDASLAYAGDLDGFRPAFRKPADTLRALQGQF